MKKKSRSLKHLEARNKRVQASNETKKRVREDDNNDDEGNTSKRQDLRRLEMGLGESSPTLDEAQVVLCVKGLHLDE